MKHTKHLTAAAVIGLKMISLALVGATAACQATAFSWPEVRSTLSPSAPFERYRTFSIGLAERPPSGAELSARALDAQRRMRPLVVAALETRGYVEDRGKPDLVIKLASGTKVVTTSESETWKDDSYEEGLVSIDVFDSTTGTQVWHGDAIAPTGGGQINDALLQRSVSGMLAAFPGRRAPADSTPSVSSVSEQ